jgi:hypothetical protein
MEMNKILSAFKVYQQNTASKENQRIIGEALSQPEQNIQRKEY